MKTKSSVKAGSFNHNVKLVRIRAGVKAGSLNHNVKLVRA